MAQGSRLRLVTTEFLALSGACCTYVDDATFCKQLPQSHREQAGVSQLTEDCALGI